MPLLVQYLSHIEKGLLQRLQVRGLPCRLPCRVCLTLRALRRRTATV
jgi:hypothetical protein